MPKSGPAYPITEEFKKRLPKRLKELGWNYTDLAEKLGVTRSAISHLMRHGTSSGLVPEIMEAVGWSDDEWKETREQLARPAGAEPLASKARESSESAEVEADAIGELVGELVGSFLALSSENRSRVLERIRVLREEELRHLEHKKG